MTSDIARPAESQETRDLPCVHRQGRIAPAISNKAARQSDPGGLDRVCEEMESLFLSHLMKEMRETIPKGGLIGGSSPEAAYTSLLDAERARSLSQSGGIGLAEVLKQQLGRPRSGRTGAEEG